MITNLDAADEAATISVRDGGYLGAVQFAIRGTFVGTVLFEGCVDLAAGTPVWTAIGAKKLIDETIVASVTAAAVVAVPAAGFESVRARCSAYTSGTIVVESSHIKNATITF